MLNRLDQAEVALGERQIRVAWQCAEHRDADLCDRIGNQQAMPLGAHPVENDTANAHHRIVRVTAAHDGGGRLGLS